MTAFEEVLRRARLVLGTDAKLAGVIGISPSRVSRAKRGEYPTLNVVNCLRLAEAIGELPGLVLRAAGKSDAADLIERLYGAGQPALSPADRAHLDAWHALDDDQRSALSTVLSSMLTVRRAARIAKQTKKLPA